MTQKGSRNMDGRKPFRTIALFCQDWSPNRSYFKNTREIFGLTVAGQSVTTPENILEIYKNQDTLTFKEYPRDIYAAFSMSPEGIARMFEPAPSDCDKDRAVFSQKLNDGI